MKHNLWVVEYYIACNNVSWTHTYITSSTFCSLIVCFFVGAVHIGNCELDERIPKWMVVYGSVSLAYTLVNIFKSICCPNRKRQERERSSSEDSSSSSPNSCANSLEGIFNLFLFVWLIVGSVWVLGKYDDWDSAGRPDCDDLPSDDPNYDKCCHEGMFLFAFIFIITMWSLGFLIICCACSCACLVLTCVGKGQQQA